jgi:transcription initiation factor TFIIF subunit beta
VSLRLDAQPENQDLPKDYVLKRQNVNADNTSFAVQNSYVFTERDIPGHKNRLDVLFGEARSALYESMKREAKKKAQKKKWEPYVRKTIPSMCSTFSSEEISTDPSFATRAHGYCRKGEG